MAELDEKTIERVVESVAKTSDGAASDSPDDDCTLAADAFKQQDAADAPRPAAAAPDAAGAASEREAEVEAETEAAMSPAASLQQTKAERRAMLMNSNTHSSRRLVAAGPAASRPKSNSGSQTSSGAFDNETALVFTAWSGALEVLHSGFMRKPDFKRKMQLTARSERKKHVARRYKKRWFELQTDGQLVYYGKQSDGLIARTSGKGAAERGSILTMRTEYASFVLGSIDLTTAFRVERSKIADAPATALDVLVATASGGTMAYTIAPPTEEEMDIWHQMLNVQVRGSARVGADGSQCATPDGGGDDADSFSAPSSTTMDQLARADSFFGAEGEIGAASRALQQLQQNDVGSRGAALSTLPEAEGDEAADDAAEDAAEDAAFECGGIRPTHGRYSSRKRKCTVS